MQSYDPYLAVVGYSEVESLVAKGHGFRVLDIVAVSHNEAERVKGDDEISSLKFTSSSGSEKVILPMLLRTSNSY